MVHKLWNSLLSTTKAIEGLGGKRASGILLKSELCQKHAIHISHTVLFRCVNQCSVCFFGWSMLHFWDIKNYAENCSVFWCLQNWVFLHTLFLKSKVQIDKNNYRTMLFMWKQVSLPKISLILQKMKIDPKSDICPFCTKVFKVNPWPAEQFIQTGECTWLTDWVSGYQCTVDFPWCKLHSVVKITCFYFSAH